MKNPDEKEIRRLRESEERGQLERGAQRAFFEFIIDMLPVGLGVRKNIDTAPVIEFENRALKEMFADPDDPDYCGWCAPPANLPTQVILDATGVYAEERQYPNGRIYQFTIKYYRDGDTWYELQLVRDVTRRRMLEDEVQQAKDDLEHKVEERTLELRQKQTQLVQSEKMAALGHLVAGVAHEINTPLGALKSNNDLIARSMAKLHKMLVDEGAEAKPNPELEKILTGIEGLHTINTTAMARIVTLVKSLRKFARLDQAEQDQVDIHEGLESTLTLVHHELKNRVTIHKDYDQLPLINVFPNQINQVFMNILVNAGQAIEDKGDIYLRTYKRDDHVVVEFKDTGKGISKEHLARIFDPGFTTKGSGVGTGLGLSIVYQIIKDHDGEIEVESEIGKGTTIRILLPIR